MPVSTWNEPRGGYLKWQEQGCGNKFWQSLSNEQSILTLTLVLACPQTAFDDVAPCSLWWAFWLLSNVGRVHRSIFFRNIVISDMSDFFIKHFLLLLLPEKFDQCCKTGFNNKAKESKLRLRHHDSLSITKSWTWKTKLFFLISLSEILFCKCVAPARKVVLLSFFLKTVTLLLKSRQK